MKKLLLYLFIMSCFGSKAQYILQDTCLDVVHKKQFKSPNLVGLDSCLVWLTISEGEKPECNPLFERVTRSESIQGNSYVIDYSVEDLSASSIVQNVKIKADQSWRSIISSDDENDLRDLYISYTSPFRNLSTLNVQEDSMRLVIESLWNIKQSIKAREREQIDSAQAGLIPSFTFHMNVSSNTSTQ